ncbi:MAG: redoxin domain-containing protein [Bacteroidetes bacterium]|nr:redoxin domain-containing protein [Bacteroidota bacterium]
MIVTSRTNPRPFRLGVLLTATLLLLISHFQGLAQGLTATFNFKAPNQKVFLASYYGEKMALIDSGVTSKEGQITFFFNAKRQVGMYRVLMNRQQFVDFIYNREEINITHDFDKEDAKPIVNKSKENKILYEFLGNENMYKKKMGVLSLVGQQYPEKDAYYTRTEKEYADLLQQRNKYLKGLLEANKGTFAARVLALYQDPSIPWSLPMETSKKYLREHYFDNYTLTDTLLIRTNLLTNKAIDYLSLYTSQNMGQLDAEKGFIEGVDVLMKTLEGSKVHDFMLSYLVGGFEKYKMETVLTHLYEKYITEESCNDGVKKEDVIRRLKAYEQLSVGKTAPDFLLRDVNGNEVKIASIQKDYFLMVFWASWCPHCHDLLSHLPELKASFESGKVAVITASLDTSRTAWTDYLTKNKVPWINTCDTKGWDGKIMKDYNIYATPTMFLIDKQRKIIAKPITFMDLTEALKQAGIK